MATKGNDFSEFQPKNINVLGHLNSMKEVFEMVKDLSSENLYVYLSHFEMDYMHGPVENFAATVHMLNPVGFQNDRQSLNFARGKRTNDIAISERMTCPYCSTKLVTANAYSLHIKRATVSCAHCKEPITYEAFVLATFVYNFNRGDYPIKSSFDALLSFGKSNSTWKTFSAYLLAVVKSNQKLLALPTTERRRHAVNLRMEVRGLISKVRDNLSCCLSMDLIKGMYRQLSFVNKICSNFEYWTNKDVIAASVERYFKFVQLIRSHRGKTLVPTMDIDLVWHAHQTDPSSYNTYTRAMLERLLNHDDTIGTDDLGKGYARTFIFWAQAYKEPYSSTKPTFSQWQRGHNIVSLVVPPVGIYRLYVWNKFSNLPAPVVPVAEKIDPHGGGGNPISVVGVPVMEPGTVTRNQLSRNVGDSTNSNNNNSSYAPVWIVGVGGCAGSCGSAGCAAGSCGTGGCGGSCGGGSGCGGGGCGGGGCGGGGCGGG